MSEHRMSEREQSSGDLTDAVIAAASPAATVGPNFAPALIQRKLARRVARRAVEQSSETANGAVAGEAAPAGAAPAGGIDKAKLQHLIEPLKGTVRDAVVGCGVSAEQAAADPAQAGKLERVVLSALEGFVNARVAQEISGQFIDEKRSAGHAAGSAELAATLRGLFGPKWAFALTLAVGAAKEYIHDGGAGGRLPRRGNEDWSLGGDWGADLLGALIGAFASTGEPKQGPYFTAGPGGVEAGIKRDNYKVGAFMSVDRDGGRRDTTTGVKFSVDF